MSDSYSWDWISPQVALQTIHRTMKVADAEALAAAMPGHVAGGPGGGQRWGLVVDVRGAGVVDEAVQAAVKDLMQSLDDSGCDVVAMVVTKTIVMMQSKRLSQEARGVAFDVFDSVPEAMASVQARLAAAA